MNQPEDGEWARRWTEAIGQQLQRLRGQRNLSARELSERTADLGYLVPRNTIANLENGRKTSASVAEVAILAAALDVPPVLLLYSMTAASVERLPGDHVHPVAAIDWFGADNDHLMAMEDSLWVDGAEDVGLGADVDALTAVRSCLRLRKQVAAGHRLVNEHLADMPAGMGEEARRSIDEQNLELDRQLRAVVKEARRLGVPLPEAITTSTNDDHQGEQ